LGDKNVNELALGSGKTDIRDYAYLVEGVASYIRVNDFDNT